MYIYDANWTEEMIYEAASHLEGKSLGELDKTGWLDKKKQDKGAIGNMIQSDFFGIPANSNPGPDFQYHGIELKVTPIIKNTKGFSSKERLVLGMINYQKDYLIPFKESVVFQKAKVMLLVFYLYQPNTNAKKFKIMKVKQFTLPATKMNIVQQDYKKIKNFIMNGKAEQLSEKNHEILSPCTKGQGRGKDFVKQPFSKILAKSRAYSFKVGFMSKYFREITDTSIPNPNTIKSFKYEQKKEHVPLVAEEFPEYKIHIFEEYISEILSPYLNKTIKEIGKEVNYKEIFKTTKLDKSSNYKLLSLMFGSKNGRINATDEFIKEGYEVKSVVRHKRKDKNQDMSFKNIDFKDVNENEFEDSEWNVMFGETTYVFCFFDESNTGEYIFKDFSFYFPTENVIDAARKLFYLTKNSLNQGVKAYVDEKGIFRDTLPTGKKHAPPFQIRTKYTKQSKFVTLPDGTDVTKKCLFLNKEFIDELRK